MPIDFPQAANVNVGDLGDNPLMVKHLVGAQNKLQNFSKAWGVGTQATCFYPYRLIKDPENEGRTLWVPCMSALYGHVVGDFKAMGRGFVVSRSALSANAEVIGAGDLAYQFSKLAPLLVNAMKEKELADLAKKNWDMLGQAAYQQARAEVEKKYDRKNNMYAIKPLLGRLAIQMNTVVAFIATDPTTAAPMWETPADSASKTGLFVQVLSGGRRDKLDALANSPVYGIAKQHPDKTYSEGDVEFLEVMYSFTSANMSKAEAGRCDPQGVSHDVSMFSRYPDQVAKLNQMLERVPTKAADIRAKLYKMEPMTDEELRVKFQQYTIKTLDCWGCLTDEDKGRLVGCANVIDHMRIRPTDADLCSKLEEALGHPVGQGSAGAPTIDELAANPEDFDVNKQAAAVDAAVHAAETGGDAGQNVAEFAGEVEV